MLLVTVSHSSVRSWQNSTGTRPFFGRPNFHSRKGGCCSLARSRPYAITSLILTTCLSILNSCSSAVSEVLNLSTSAPRTVFQEHFQLLRPHLSWVTRLRSLYFP